MLMPGERAPLFFFEEGESEGEGGSVRGRGWVLLSMVSSFGLLADKKLSEKEDEACMLLLLVPDDEGKGEGKLGGASPTSALPFSEAGRGKGTDEGGGGEGATVGGANLLP